jgi:hypothetical protein
MSKTDKLVMRLLSRPKDFTYNELKKYYCRLGIKRCKEQVRGFAFRKKPIK